MNIYKYTPESNGEESMRDASTGRTRTDEQETFARADCYSSRDVFDNDGNLAGRLNVESDASEPSPSLRDLRASSRASSGAVESVESKRRLDHSSGGSSGRWVCSRCTFENEISTRKCIVCGEGVRPVGMGRSQPHTPRGLEEEEENRDPVSDSQQSAKKAKARIWRARCGWFGCQQNTLL